MLFENKESRFNHLPVVVTSDFVKVSLLMSGKLHHPGKILILVVPSEELQFAIAANQYKRRTVATYPKQRSIFVNGRL